MKKEVKLLLKNIGLGIGVFFGVFVCAFLLIFQALNIFYERGILSASVLLISAFATAVILGVILTSVFFVKKHKNKPNFFTDKSSKFLFYFFLFQGFVNAFKKDVVLTIESAQKLVEIEWLIFSIAITLFVVWHAVVSKIIEKRPKDGLGATRIEALQTKQELYNNSSNFIYNLILLILSLFCLTMITASVYLDSAINKVTQFVVIFNITIIIDAMMVIFYDIAMPLFAELILNKKYKMSDQAVIDELVLAMAEEKLKEKFNAREMILTEEQITSMAKEILLKIKTENLVSKEINKENTDESNT